METHYHRYQNESGPLYTRHTSEVSLPFLLQKPLVGRSDDMDEATLLAALRRHWEYEGTDYEMSHEIYHDDAVLEFPQSQERFEGKANFLAWRKNYPAGPSPK